MSDKRTYPSRYSPDKLVTPAQYIVELICEKKAALNGGDLPVQFWKIPKWASFYRQQIVSANGLLRIYSPTAIINALKSNGAYGIFSLRAPHLDMMIKAEQSKVDILENRVKNSEDTVRVDTTIPPRPQRTEKTKLSKLREIDDG